VTRDVARRAAQLRARYRLRPADALQMATALVHGATAFVTNDRQLTRLAPVLDIITLDDFAAVGRGDSSLNWIRCTYPLRLSHHWRIGTHAAIA
jgi:RecA-family ATPase